MRRYRPFDPERSGVGVPEAKIEQHELTAVGRGTGLRVEHGPPTRQRLGEHDSAFLGRCDKRLDGPTRSSHPHEPRQSDTHQDASIWAPTDAVGARGARREIGDRLHRTSLEEDALERLADTEAQPLTVGGEERLAGPSLWDQSGSQLIQPVERPDEQASLGAFLGDIRERASIR